MRRRMIALAAALMGAAAMAADAPPRPILSTTKTSAGQPIIAPSGPLQVTASIADIPAGGSTPVHKHPYQRLAYVLAGRIQMKNFDSGQTLVFETGQMTADPVGQWHQGTALDGKPVRLLVIDETPPGQSNTIAR